MLDALDVAGDQPRDLRSIRLAHARGSKVFEMNIVSIPAAEQPDHQYDRWPQQRGKPHRTGWKGRRISQKLQLDGRIGLQRAISEHADEAALFQAVPDLDHRTGRTQADDLWGQVRIDCIQRGAD